MISGFASVFNPFSLQNKKDLNFIVNNAYFGKITPLCDIFIIFSFLVVDLCLNVFCCSQALQLQFMRNTECVSFLSVFQWDPDLHPVTLPGGPVQPAH